MVDAAVLGLLRDVPALTPPLVDADVVAGACGYDKVSEFARDCERELLLENMIV
jgi:hypothetical protein